MLIEEGGYLALAPTGEHIEDRCEYICEGRPAMQHVFSSRCSIVGYAVVCSKCETVRFSALTASGLNIAYPTASCLTAQDSPGRTLRPPRMPYAYYTSQSHTTDMYKRFTPGTPLSQARLVARRLMLGIEVSSEVARQKVRRPGRLDVSDQVFARNLDVLGLDARCFGDFGGLFREDGLEEGGVDLLARVGL